MLAVGLAQVRYVCGVQLGLESSPFRCPSCPAVPAAPCQHSPFPDFLLFLPQDMIHIADTKVARRYGDFFIRQIHKFEEVRPDRKNCVSSVGIVGKGLGSAEPDEGVLCVCVTAVLRLAGQRQVVRAAAAHFGGSYFCMFSCKKFSSSRATPKRRVLLSNAADCTVPRPVWCSSRLYPHNEGSRKHPQRLDRR